MAKRKSTRLFVGIALPDGLAMQLSLLGGGIPGARWESADKLHLTLHFFGDVDGGVRPQIERALQGVRHAPFSLGLFGTGHFPPRGEPRSLWLGARPCDALHRLHHDVSAAVEAIGLEPDPRKFVPHVTLARLRNAPSAKVAAFMGLHALYEPPPFVVERITLFSSILAPGGSKYTREAEFELTGE